MYRGILESHPFVTTFLKRQIYERGLDAALDRGRIYRVVHESIRPGPSPRLSRLSAAELVALLTHGNGWWRDTAQRLLVERGDRSVAPQLSALARTHGDEITRLHALWTLEGLGALTPESVAGALADAHPKVRSAALRLAEPSLQKPDGGSLTAAVVNAVDDADAGVRLQAAMTLGELPGGTGEAALARLLLRHPSQPFIVDAVVSGLRGRELEFLERISTSEPWKTERPDYNRIASALAAAIFTEAVPARIARLLRWTGAPERRHSLQLAVLGSVDKPVRLERAVAMPAALVEAGDERIKAASRTLAGFLSVVSRNRGESELTAQEKSLFRSGARGYTVYCAQCHQADGRGLADTAAPLAGSKWVLGSGEITTRIVLHGKQRQTAIMPPWGNVLDDQTVAAILTYIRRAWGNDGAAILPVDVRRVRAETTSVSTLWTEETLLELASALK
jgi:mono/diheme cytochrome c family protein